MELYRSAFTQTQLISAATITTTAATFVKLGEYKVSAGETVALGFGEQSGQDNSVGRLHMDMQNATVAVEGTIRLSVQSPQNRPIMVLGEWRTETLRGGTADRSLQVPFPVSNVFVSEDKKIVLEFMADASGIVDRVKTKILMDTTVEAL